MGQFLFPLYIADLLRMVRAHGLNPNLYAEDAQIYGLCWHGNSSQLKVMFLTA